MVKNDKTKKKKNQVIDPYLRQIYFDVDNSDEKVPNYQDEERFEPYNYPEYGIDGLRYKRQVDNSIDVSPKQEPPRKYQSYLAPLYGITAVFGAILIIGPFLVRKGPNRGIFQASIMLTAFCMWIFWFTIYFGQMNPLMGPRLENTTVAWIAYKIGNPVPAPPLPPEPEPGPPGEESTTPEVPEAGPPSGEPVPTNEPSPRPEDQRRF